MKIPNTNICCKFLYQAYKLNPHIEIVKFEEHGAVTQDGEIIPFNKLRKLYRATSIKQVPYWRLYIVKHYKEGTWYGVRHRREIIHKTFCNYSYEFICELIRNTGDLKDIYDEMPGVYYSYEAWPRKTTKNKCT